VREEQGKKGALHQYTIEIKNKKKQLRELGKGKLLGKGCI